MQCPFWINWKIHHVSRCCCQTLQLLCTLVFSLSGQMQHWDLLLLLCVQKITSSLFLSLLWRPRVKSAKNVYLTLTAKLYILIFFWKRFKMFHFLFFRRQEMRFTVCRTGVMLVGWELTWGPSNKCLAHMLASGCLFTPSISQTRSCKSMHLHMIKNVLSSVWIERHVIIGNFLKYLKGSPEEFPARQMITIQFLNWLWLFVKLGFTKSCPLWDLSVWNLTESHGL